MSDNRLQTINYIADMSRELNKMAIAAQSPLLALLLDMAAKEGHEIVKASKKKNNSKQSGKASTKTLNDLQPKKHNHQHVE